MTGGYEAIYFGLVGKLTGFDLEESARRLGLDYVDGKVQVSFLKREYLIAANGVEPMDGRAVKVNNRRVLLYYLFSKGQGEPEDSDVLFESIPRMISGLDSQKRILSRPLEQYFCNDPIKFGAAAMRLDGVEEES